jgi:hypothetical protein
MAKARRHYPVAIYVLTLVCALGLAAVAVGIADGWFSSPLAYRQSPSRWSAST